ncbi:ABC transporter permease [Microbacterium sp. NPDC058342]|uniref:ABC transporter permease n=1 Tax=Microbacterium sp. NPDC058342 TaxID=3346454 RepID=UPI0036575205
MLDSTVRTHESRARYSGGPDEADAPRLDPWLVRTIKYIRFHWFTYLLVLPGLLCMIVFNYGPMYGLQLAFKDYSVSKGIWGSPWVGIDNFVTMFNDAVFWNALVNTLEINVWNILFGFTFNILLALLINELRLRWVKSTVQTLVYLPYFLSWVVFAGLVMAFLSLSSDGGVVNAILGGLGLKEIDFLREPELFQAVLVISNIVKTAGYSSIIYLAAIAGINPALYESAAIDGANRLQMMWHITLPRIMPSVVVLLILQLATVFVSNFDQVYNLYSSFVYSTGDVLSTYIYRNSIGGGGNFEVSTAMNLMFNVAGLIVVLFANKIVKKLDVMGIF